MADERAIDSDRRRRQEWYQNYSQGLKIKHQLTGNRMPINLWYGDLGEKASGAAMVSDLGC